MKIQRQVTQYVWLYLFVFLIWSSFTFAERQQETSIFDHLSFDEVLKVDIETDLDSLVSTKLTEEEVPATFSYKDKRGKEWKWEVKLEVRGKFRRRVCPFPPLFVNFSKKDLKAAGFNDHNDLKLVTHCVDNDQGDENVLREYLAYKLYEILSDKHYRVQLLKIRYRDDNGKLSCTRYGILMEDEDELKERYDSKLCEDCYSLPKDSFNLQNLQTHNLFQYMIGNTDWSLAMARNMKLLKSKEDGKFSIVPYDFDFSGLVSAPYASVDKSLGLKSVRERKYLGFAESPEELEPTIELFRSKRKEILNYIKKFKLLNMGARQDMSEFIESFYRCLEDGLDLEEPGKC